MPTSKAQQRATNKYASKAYDRINLFVSKGKKEIIQTHAKSRGESTNAFINRAIGETMNRDSGIETSAPCRQPVESQVGYLTDELLEVAQKAVKAHGGELSDFIRDAINSYAKSYPSIMQIKSREAELYAVQQEAQKRVGIEQPEEPENQEDSFSNVSTKEILEKFMSLEQKFSLNRKGREPDVQEEGPGA